MTAQSDVSAVPAARDPAELAPEVA
ncbi:MAG: hypothetical protein JWP28_1675, partial [Phenylobacterium sp.]|nr:hypothetical protein [Phenylobacterium sp.]